MPLPPLLAFAAAGLIAASAFAQTSAPSTLAVPPGATRIKLWPVTPDVIAGRDTDVDPLEPTMDIYLPPPDQATGAAVVVFPGGGYTNLSTKREGSDEAAMLLSHHVAAFVVRYRHAPRYHYPTPILDGQRALRIVRSKAAEYKINPNRIGVMGFSAGGHLAATMATSFDAGNPTAADEIDRVSSRPDFAVLLYPVITFTDEQNVHKGSRTALAGNHPELYAQLSPELHVTKDTPPVFLAHASPDKTVPVENSVLFYLACHKAGIPAELHIFEQGSHGFALAQTDPALRVWPDLMVTWMNKNHILTPEGKQGGEPATR
jgi:acetyl esterase/lipase